MTPLRVVLLLAVLISVAPGCTRSKTRSAPVDAIDETELVKNNNRFALDLYAKLGAQPGNLFFSPYSISTALGMTYAGARGATAEQMAKTLHFPSDQARLHPANATLLKQLQSAQGKGFELAIANALWVQKGLRLQPDFAETAKQDYEAGAREVDFMADREAARKEVNQWVARQTKDKIKDLLQSSDVGPLTRLILTNAIYFKGNWAARFPKDGTHDSFFFLGKKKQVRVPFMSQCATFPLVEYNSFSILELPYDGKSLSMVILMPAGSDDLPEFEKKVTVEKLKEWRSNMAAQQINIYMPRFKVTARLNMKSTLQDMGMPAAFDKDQADFTGITGDDPEKKLHISNVIHQAFVEVNEEGTEAAGSTAVIGGAKSGDRIIHEPPTIYINRPFLFLIRDNRSGAILFMGRITDPS